MIREITELPGICTPIRLRVDIDQLIASVNILLGRLAVSYDNDSHFSINLTHLPNLAEFQ
jgi:hypothetical protein